MNMNTLCPSVFDADIPRLDYKYEEPPAQVYPRLLAAQQQSPVAIGPWGPEVIGYELARTLLRDQRFVIPPGITLMAAGITSGPLWDKLVNSIICLNGEEHRRIRLLVSKAFTPRATDRLEDTIVDVINGLVDGVAGAGRCDIVTDIARPYPVPIICALLGAPPEDWEQFSLWADIIFKAFNLSPEGVDVEGVMKAWGELDDYIDNMIVDRHRNPADDLLTDLVRAEAEGHKLTPDDLRLLASGLLMAGTDTTRNQVAGSVDIFCDHPDQWALLAERPELAPNAVEETMRHSPIASGTMRLATEDIEVDGLIYPEGTMVLVNTFATNRDRAVYDEPDRFDITRDVMPAVMTFGGGVHFCLGANLARKELCEALRVLSRRMPDLKRTGPAPWKPMLGLSGPFTLPVEFSRA